MSGRRSFVDFFSENSQLIIFFLRTLILCLVSNECHIIMTLYLTKVYKMSKDIGNTLVVMLALHTIASEVTLTECCIFMSLCRNELKENHVFYCMLFLLFC